MKRRLILSLQNYKIKLLRFQNVTTNKCLIKMSKKCPLCHQILKRKIKRIKEVNIFECLKCSIALLDKNLKMNHKLYSLVDYQKEEKRLKHRFF